MYITNNIIVSSLICLEEDKEIINNELFIPDINNKPFDMKTLKMCNTSENVLSKENLTNENIIPYISTINYIKVNPKFLKKEELRNVKLFPTREWEIIESNDSIKTQSDILEENQPKNRFHKIVIFVVDRKSVV